MVTIKADYFDIGAIAESGQCFRLDRTGEGSFRLIALDRVLRILQTGDGSYQFDCTPEEFDSLWRPYFDLDEDYARYAVNVPPADQFLQAALAFGRGIRILRQTPWEMLITFIISQRKNIPAIKAAVATLSRRYGQPIAGEADCFAFPAPQALAACGDTALRACALGYRSGYIEAAARMVADGTLDLEGLRALDDEALHQALLRVPGVGTKVANCVMLFGYHRIAAFPRDVWINRIIDAEYGGAFPLERYAGYAGVIQQYMFFYARSR